MTRLITVTSGKGGVGKTNICVNLSICLAKLGKKVCLFDADLGLANINILLGLYPDYTLKDVILNKKSIDEILIRNVNGIDIIPGSSGIEKMANLDFEEVNFLINAFSTFDNYDYILFDTSAGASSNVVSFCLSSPEIILVITPEPTSLTDAYSLLKILTLNGLKSSVTVIVNQSKNPQIAKQIFIKFKETVKKYLSININPLGTVIKDSHVAEAVRLQNPYSISFPNSNATKCINKLAQQIIKKNNSTFEIKSLDKFWVKWLDFIKKPLDFGKGVQDNTKPKKTNNNGFMEKFDESLLNQEIYKKHNDFENKISELTCEIAFIKKYLEERDIETYQFQTISNDLPMNHQPKILLDFEEFSKHHIE